MRVGTYQPLVAGDHDDACAALCTDYNPGSPDRNGCPYSHHCWCRDGALSYAEFQLKHPDCMVAEA